VTRDVGLEDELFMQLQAIYSYGVDIVLNAMYRIQNPGQADSHQAPWKPPTPHAGNAVSKRTDAGLVRASAPVRQVDDARGESACSVDVYAARN
jgi:hypothetical protein